MSKKYSLAALALALLVGLGLYCLRSTEQQLSVTALVAPAEAQSKDATATVEVPELTVGKPEAKVTLMEYASLTCSHCARFHADVFKPLKANYIDTGKVRFIMREVYFDRNGLWASMVARCAGPDRYFGLVSLLFETQAEWAQKVKPMVVTDLLKKKGRLAGMTDTQINACMADSAMAKAMVAAYLKNTTADDVQSTPTIFVNGKKYTNMTYDDLKVIIDAELVK